MLQSQIHILLIVKLNNNKVVIYVGHNEIS